MRCHDFIALQETHSTEGYAKAIDLPTDIRRFWSHATTRQAGIALWLKASFLAQFNPADDSSWEQIEPGRAAVLRLRGPRGGLDVFVLYHHTGDDLSARACTRAAIAAKMRPQSEVLSVVLGDFNYVCRPRDRFSKDTAEWTGGRDAAEEDQFNSLLGSPFSFCELQQEDFTHDSVSSRSRLDRVYMNHFLTDQLDRCMGCVALAWVPHLSAHRPISFFRRKKERRFDLDAPIPTAPSHDPRWPERVALRFGELRREDSCEDQPLRRLVLIKKAIREASWRTHAQSRAVAATNDSDKLGWTMRFLRAAEELRLHAMRKCAAAYAVLGTLVNIEDPNLRVSNGLRKVRDHALELARASILDELREIHSEASKLDDQQRQIRREHIQTRLKRMVPGASTVLKAIRTPDGSITATPEDMASALRDYWSQIFAHKGVDRQKLACWLQEVFPDGGLGRTVAGLPAAASNQWNVEREHIERAVQSATDSMPGPDGIPYAGWKALGALGIDVLFDAAKALARPDSSVLLRAAHGNDQEEHEFNLGTLCCLPKKPTGVDNDLGEYYAPESTRPLSIVNTDNRLIANSYRYCWEAIFAHWVSGKQRGFLPGRSMMSNVVDVDYEAMTVSLTAEFGALILFDFKAAFPSISHDYLFDVLRHLGLPPEAMHVVEALYNGNRCVISCGGTKSPGFTMQAGIRQGCPLSPLLFAVVVDLMLRKLSALSPHDLLRAFADDTAMVTSNWWDIAASVQSAFEEFGTISGLILNLPKTVLIPLWPAPLENVKAELARRLPAWAAVEVARWGTYLGFATGPGKQDHSWDKPLLKYQQRIAQWNWSGLGLQYAAVAYNTYAVTTLSYVSQLEAPPETVLAAEQDALRRVAPGPGFWAISEDLWYLKENFGFPVSFAHLRLGAWAAQIRVATLEDRRNGGLHVRTRARALRNARGGTDYMERVVRWRSWYDRSHVLVLDQAVTRMSQAGITTEATMTELARGAPRPWSTRCQSIINKGFQRQIRHKLLLRERPCAESRLRHKLKRWALPGIPRHNATAGLRHLRGLNGLVAPRVFSAVFSTVWNRWRTACRFQKRQSAHNRCVLGCGGRAEDSVEHYCRCRIVLDVAYRFLGLRFPDGCSLAYWLQVALALDDKDLQTRTAVLVYAAYRAYNAARHAGDTSEDVSKQMIIQYVKEAVRGHSASMKIVDDYWMQAARSKRRRL